MAGRTTIVVDKIADWKKALTALAGVAALLLAQGTLSGGWATAAQVVVAVGTVLGVQKVTDGRKAKPCAATVEDAPSDDGPAAF